MLTARLGMSGKSYCCPEIFARDVETKLMAGWMCLGRIDEIPEPGDYFTVQLFTEPLIIVRGEDYEVRVLANVCRHRASPVAQGAGNSRRFVCPYHAWSYDLNGNLRSASRMPKEMVAGLCLPSYRTEIWQGFLYVNLDGSAAPLSQQLSKLEDRIAPYRPAEFRTFHTAEKLWQANWKSVVENFLEAYHLSVVHSATLNDYTPTGLAKKFDGGAAFTGYCAHYPKNAASRGEGAPHLSAEKRRCSTLFSVFPCHLVSQAASLLASFSLIPLSSSQTQVRWSLSAYADDLTESLKADRITLWSKVNDEDQERLEATQLGIGSRFAEAGPIAPEHLEGTIADFHDYLVSHNRYTAIT